MITSLRKFISSELLPPALYRVYQGSRQDNIDFSGDYAAWGEARQQCTGYDAEAILEKVKASALKVKYGEAVYERDSVLFDKVQYSFPVLAGLLRVATMNAGKLRVLDFGGSLGSSYYQCRSFLSHLREVQWCIVEQPGYVACGRKYFEDETLCFFGTIDDCLQVKNIDVVLLSSVIQYLPDPHDFLRQLVQYGFRHIVIDRTAFIEGDRDRLTVQTVPEWIYKASYPAWFLNEEGFLSHFQKDYSLITDFDSFGYDCVDGKRVWFKGFIFEQQ